MSPNEFDRVTRQVTNAVTRRDVVKVIAAGIVSWAASVFQIHEINAGTTVLPPKAYLPLIMKPVPPHCTNNVKDAEETDVDCGGPDCPKCANGQTCLLDTDCASGHCSGNVCVACVAASDCPGGDTECQTRTCISNTCGFTYTAYGTATTSQTAGDCQINICNGAGAVISVADNTDLPNDNNQCTQDMCVDGVPSYVNESAGTGCNQSGGTVCNGLGECVGCVTDAECAGYRCVNQTCAASCTTNEDCATGYVCDNSICIRAPTCSDNIQNGDEFDVDCGG